MRWTILALVMLCGCAADDIEDTGEAQDPFCGPETPIVTYETFGQGFVDTYCQGCHASTTPNRQGAPEILSFDTETDVLGHAASILDATVPLEGDARMPPNGGPSDEDRERLEIWLTCFVDY